MFAYIRFSWPGNFSYLHHISSYFFWTFWFFCIAFHVWIFFSGHFVYFMFANCSGHFAYLHRSLQSHFSPLLTFWTGQGLKIWRFEQSKDVSLKAYFSLGFILEFWHFEPEIAWKYDVLSNARIGFPAIKFSYLERWIFIFWHFEPFGNLTFSVRQGGAQANLSWDTEYRASKYDVF